MNRMYVDTNKNYERETANGTNMFITLLCIAAIIVIQLYLGKYLWNNVLVDLLPNTVRPITNILQVLGLIVLSIILFSGMTYKISYECYNKQ